jgi:hypothetical protein
MARRVSAAPQSGTLPRSEPLAGLSTSKRAALSASTQAPSMIGTVAEELRDP